MTQNLADTLDTALERLRAGEPLPAILAYYPAQAEALRPLLSTATLLETVHLVEMPAPEALLADRNSFLDEITRLQLQAVSPGPVVRLKEWIAHHNPWPSPGPIPQQKEQRRMNILLVKATLVISMIFGSAGGAVVLAADSLPGSPLYPAKLAVEQVRLATAATPADQATMHLVLAQVRAQEMERLALAGEVPDEATLTRLQTHLNAGLDLAARLPDQAMLDWLIQAQQMTRTQEQALAQAQTRTTGPVQEPLRQASRFLNQVRQEVETGLKDPQTFRRRHTEGRPPEAPAQPTVSPVPGPVTPSQAAGPCPTGDCQPVGDKNQYGPQPEQPGPGMPGGNPDGTCSTDDCQPVGDEHQYGPQPEQPGPGMPGGNPDGTCSTDDCQPVGDEHQYGPQPEQPGPGMPGGNPDGTCSTDDCQPVGDEHQYGPQPEQPGPGMPGGNPDGTCTTGDCQPAGDENQYGPQPEQPADNASPSAPSEPATASPTDQSDGQNDSGGSDVGGNGGGGRH